MTRGVRHGEIEALERRLQALLAADGRATEQDRAAWEADQDHLLDRIGAQHAAAREEGAGLRALRHEMEGRDDADGWFSGGYDAAHQHHLDALARVDDDRPDLDDLEARSFDVQQTINAPYGNGASPDAYRSAPADADADGWAR